MLGEQPFVTRSEIGLAQQAKQFIRAIAAQDIVWIEPMRPTDRLTQNLRRPVRIDRQISLFRCNRFSDLRACPQWRFV